MSRSSITSFCLGCLILVVTSLPAHAAIETYAGFTFATPSTASVTGGFSGVASPTTTPVTVLEALTGNPLAEDGIVNMDENTFIELTFGAPVINTPGADLVVFQADFISSPTSSSAGLLAASTDFDGFTASTDLPGSLFIGTGEFETIIFSATNGTFNVEVAAALLDLTDLGLASGDSITTLRLTSTDDGDPDVLGVGALSTIPEAASIAIWTVLAGVAVAKQRHRRVS